MEWSIEHRPRRLRLHRLLPARALPQRQKLLLYRRRPDASAASILFYLLIKNGIELSDPANSESGNSWLGIGPPLVIAVFFLILGFLLMFVQWRAFPAFFRRKPEVVPAGFLEGEAAAPGPTGVGEGEV